MPEEKTASLSKTSFAAQSVEGVVVYKRDDFATANKIPRRMVLAINPDTSSPIGALSGIALSGHDGDVLSISVIPRSNADSCMEHLQKHAVPLADTMLHAPFSDGDFADLLKKHTLTNGNISVFDMDNSASAKLTQIVFNTAEELQPRLDALKKPGAVSESRKIAEELVKQLGTALFQSKVTEPKHDGHVTTQETLTDQRIRG